MVATKLQKYEARKIYKANHKVAKNDKIGSYVWDMKQAGVTTDANVVKFLQTNFPKSKEWKLGVNLQIDEQLKVVNGTLASPLTKCSTTALIQKCSPDALPTGADTDLLANFVARAYMLDGKAIVVAKITTADLKNANLALKGGSDVKSAVADQETAKALTAVPEIGAVIVDNQGAIQTSESQGVNVKLSTIAGFATDYNTTSGCNLISVQGNCGYVLKAGVWNYLNDGKGGTGADGGGKAGIAGAAQIHDYLGGVAIVEATQATAEKNINAVADSKIPNAFDEIGEVHKAGNATA